MMVMIRGSCGSCADLICYSPSDLFEHSLRQIGVVRNSSVFVASRPRKAKRMTYNASFKLFCTRCGLLQRFISSKSTKFSGVHFSIINHSKGLSSFSSMRTKEAIATLKTTVSTVTQSLKIPSNWDLNAFSRILSSVKYHVPQSSAEKSSPKPIVLPREDNVVEPMRDRPQEDNRHLQSSASSLYSSLVDTVSAVKTFATFKQSAPQKQNQLDANDSVPSIEMIQDLEKPAINETHQLVKAPALKLNEESTFVESLSNLDEGMSNKVYVTTKQTDSTTNYQIFIQQQNADKAKAMHVASHSEDLIVRLLHEAKNAKGDNRLEGTTFVRDRQQSQTSEVSTSVSSVKLDANTNTMKISTATHTVKLSLFEQLSSIGNLVSWPSFTLPKKWIPSALISQEASPSAVMTTDKKGGPSKGQLLAKPPHQATAETLVIVAPKKELVARASIEKRTRGLVRALALATGDVAKLTRLEELSQHLVQYPDAKSAAVKERVIPLLLRLRKSRSNMSDISQSAREVLALVGYTDPIRSRGIRILTLDGGGTRGLISIELLRQLEHFSQKRIYELFDYICGVSTGSLIAMMVGVFRLPLDECDQLYRDCSREMFRRNRFMGTSKLFTSLAYYDAELWEKLLRENLPAGTFYNVNKDPLCCKLSAVSCMVNTQRPSNYLFRNYTFPPGVSSHYEGSMSYNVWEGIRASSAAPLYYAEKKLGDHIHQDGGLLTNNPTAIAIHEGKLLWPNEALQCVVSIGTGRYEPGLHSETSPNNFGGLKQRIAKLVQSATDTEAVHIVLNDLLPPNSYFRFNPYMSEDFELDEITPEKLNQMVTDAQMYCRKNEQKLRKAAQLLVNVRTYRQRFTDWMILRRHQIG